MLDKIKRTVKHTAAFALGNINSKLVGFIFLPIYTKIISVADYGALCMLEMLDMLATHILSIGLPQALLRWHSLAESEIKNKTIVKLNRPLLSLRGVTTFLKIL